MVGGCSCGRKSTFSLASHWEVCYLTQSGPKTKIPVVRSFQNLKEHVMDPLSTTKLQFFITIARVLTPFLKKFQSEEPILLSWQKNYTQFFGHFWGSSSRKSDLDEAATAAKLCKIDVLSKQNILSPKKVDVVFVCKILLQEAQAKKKASPLQAFKFQTNKQDYGTLSFAVCNSLATYMYGS